MVFTCVHHSWSWSIKLVQFHTGWSARESKWYKLSIAWYRLGYRYRWVLPIFLQKHAKARCKACMRGVKGTQKKRKWSPIWNWWHLFIWTWIIYGVSVLGSPIGYSGFMSRFEVQGNFLLLCSSSNFVGYSYVCYLWCFYNSMFAQFVCIYVPL